MKVTFERSGGFAGTVMTAKVNTETLPTIEGEHLHQLVQTANFFRLPAKIASSHSQPDRFHYKVTAEDGSQRHTVQVSESAVPDQLQPLLNWLTEIARSQ